MSAVRLVRAGLREGRGGSPTAVTAEGPWTEAARRALPAACGASHAVFLAPSAPDGTIGLRFYTAAGELPACGHGTLAALAVLGPARTWRLRTGRRTFEGTAEAARGAVRAAFDAGPVRVRPASSAEAAPVLAALGPFRRGACHRTATGRPRLLVALEGADLAALAPDVPALRAACEHAGLLGCFAYAPTGPDHYAARMFAPAIGVDEDAANANSTAALAALHPARAITVDQGDALGAPSRLHAAVGRGGAVRLAADVAVSPPDR